MQGGGYRVVLLSDNNLSEYVTFPDYILKKYRAGTLPKAALADLLRLNLLIQYGGTWLDATILCSGSEFPAYMTKADLFLFQTDPMERGLSPTRIENFFISAKSNNKMLILWRDLLYLYWQKHDYLINYFLTYEMFELVVEAFPEEWEQVVYYPRASILTLAQEVYKPYRPDVMSALLNRFPFHKLSYKDSYREGSALDVLIKNGHLHGEGGKSSE